MAWVHCLLVSLDFYQSLLHFESLALACCLSHLRRNLFMSLVIYGSCSLDSDISVGMCLSMKEMYLWVEYFQFSPRFQHAVICSLPNSLFMGS